MPGERDLLCPKEALNLTSTLMDAEYKRKSTVGDGGFRNFATQRREALTYNP